MKDDQRDGPHTELVEHWPHRARVGIVVEIIAGLCILIGLLGWIVVVFGGKSAPAWIGGLTLAFLVGGVCWVLVVGGLLLAFWPRAVTGSTVEVVALTSGTTRRAVGLILAWTGVWWAGIAVLVWAVNDRRLVLQTPPVLFATCLLAGTVPFLMLALAIPPVGRRRRKRTTR